MRWWLNSAEQWEYRNDSGETVAVIEHNADYGGFRLVRVIGVSNELSTLRILAESLARDRTSKASP